MIDLTNIEEIKKLDPKDVFGSTEMFADQLGQIWEESKKLNYPEEYKNIKNIIICGMGGSAYGGYIAQSLFKDSLKVAVYSNNDYNLPAFADETSLILLSSYSGSTEESLSCGEEAFQKGLKVTGITGGGKLGELLTSHNSPYLTFEPKFNPSGQPRLGTGYMVLGTIALFVRLGLVSITDDDVSKAIEELKAAHDELKSKSRGLATHIQGKIPVIMSSEFLNGNAHIMRNQFNETSKSFSAFEDIPELNHHLMEGLKNPEDRKLVGLFLASNLYSEKHAKRMQLTQEVVRKNNIDILEYTPTGSSQLSQMLEVLALGGYVTLYLAILYGQDPSLIPWVDWFKEQLGK